MHQDVAPRNVLVDLNSGDLKLFDFDRSAMIGSEEQMTSRDDVDGVVFTFYETLTKDEHYREVPFDEQEIQKVEELKNWDIIVPLEEGKGGLKAYRRFLEEWATSRRTTRKIKHYSEATDPISWSAYSKPKPFIMNDPTRGPYEATRRYRTEVLEAGEYAICWERPPQKAKQAPDN